MPLEIRVMTVGDIPAGMRLCTDAGWNQLEQDWRMILESAGGAFVARVDSRTVGSVAFMRYDRLAWIAMMLVDLEFRRQGIGASLMEQALAALRNADCVGLDATPLGEPLYRRFGLANHYTLVRTKCIIAAERFAPFPSRARPMAAADLALVFARDRDVFGADRSALLASFFARAPECAWILRDGDVVRGYSFGHPGRLFDQMGPVVADDRDGARELVAACLTRLDGRVFALDASCLDPEWNGWLQSVGFTVERPFVRMFALGHTPPGKPQRQYAIASPAFG